MKAKTGAFVGIGVLLFFLTIISGTVYALEPSAEMMRLHIAKTNGVPAEDLTVGYQKLYRLALTGQEFYFGKVVDKKTGKAYGVGLDQNGTVVDYEALQAAEKAAYKAKYGKLQPALYDLLQTVSEGERVTVGIWLRSGDISLKEPRPELDGFRIDAGKLPTVAQNLGVDQLSQSGPGKKEPGQDKERVAAIAAAITAQQAGQSEAIEAATKANADHIADQIVTLRQPLMTDLEAKGITPVYVSIYAPLVYVEVPKSAIMELAQRGDVDTIYGPNVNRDLLDSAKPTQKGTIVDGWWGFTGAGVKVALVEDSRIEASNPYLTVTATRDAAGSTDQHAAATAGIVASNHSVYQGIARGASLYSANATSYTDPYLSAAMDWCVSQGVDVINNSWGGNAGTTDLNVHDRHLDFIVRNNWQTVTVAAGNESNGCGGGTGRVTSPARAYNVISVGNYADQNTLTWSDDAMDSCSSYVNPSTGVQKPEVAAVGTSIYSTTNASPWVGDVGSGTSYSAPMVAGLAALLMQWDPALKRWPEPVKAIIMATALHNIEGDSRLSDYDGAGGVDMRAAFRVANEYWRSGTSVDTSTSFPLSYYVYATAAEVVRAAIAFDSTVANDYSTDALQADLDLLVYDPDGALVAYSNSASNSYEIVEFTAPKTGNYELRVTKYSLTGSTWLGIAWWVGHRDLPAYAPQTMATPPVSRDYYRIQSTSGYWNAAGIRSPSSNDYDMYLYGNSAFANPANYNQLNYSATTSPVDFVLINGNYASVGSYFQEVMKYSGSGGNYQVEFAEGTNTVDVGTSGPFSMSPSNVLRVWDTNIPSGVRKYFALKPASGDADLGMALFGSDAGDSATWYKGRSNYLMIADAAGAGGEEYMNYQSTATDWYGLVVWNNGATATTTFYLYVDTTAPTGSISINGGASATNTTSVTLNLSASDPETGVDGMRFSNDCSAYSAWEPYATSKAWTLTSGDATKGVCVQFRNNAGMISTYSDTIFLDTVPPTGSIVINSGATYTNTTSVTLTLSATDGGSGVAQMRLGNWYSTWGPWEPYATSKAWTLLSGDGTAGVAVQYMDDAGNISNQYSDSIILDTIAPTGSILINGGATYTNTTSVILTLSATDGGSGIYQMRFSNDGSSWSAWEAYATSKAWALSAGDGTKTAYVQFRDNALNVSSSSTDTIILDTAAPAGSIVINGGAAYTNTTSVTLTLSATDGGSGMADMRFSNEGGAWSAWEPYGATKAWTLPTGEGTKTVWVQFRDNAGNSNQYSDSITLDTVAPTGSILINGGKATTRGPLVTLTLSASDAGSGISQMRFSNDGSAWSGWEAYAVSKSWTLIPGSGTRTVYVQYRDNALNVSGSYSDTILLIARREIVDIDGDGKTDTVIYRKSTGAWFIYPSEAGASGIYGLGFGGDASDKPVAADYDGDGKTDIAIYRSSTGAWFIYPSSTGPSGIYGVGFGGDASDIPVSGDYDGDGKTDLAIYRKSTGAWFIYPSSTGPSGIYGVGFGGDASDIPVPGYYDGDGKTDLAIYRKGTGAWFIKPSGGGSIYGVSFGGDASDIPVPADYDGDGKIDIAIYRKSIGAWFIKPSGGGSTYGVGFGGDASDIPVPGYYDGDEKADIGIYRKSTGAWFIYPSGGGSIYGVGFGGDASDLPVPANPASIY